MKTENSTKSYIVALNNVRRILASNRSNPKTGFLKLICYIDTCYDTGIRVCREI